MPQRVRRGHHGALHHVSVLDQGALNFKRADAIVRSFEDIIGAADEGEIALGVALDYVAGAIDRTFQRNQISIIPLVARHERGGRRIEWQGQLALFSHPGFWCWRPGAVTWKRPAHWADF